MLAGKDTKSMKRIVFHAPDEMGEAIEKEAKSRRAPISAIVREALEEYFKARGVEFETRVEWGKPTEEQDDQQGQVAAVAKVPA